MTVTLAPDAEALLSTFLRSRFELVALVDSRVYTSIPSNPTFPLVRVTRIGGIPVFSRPLRLDVATVQVDVWGGPKATAWQIAETCRAVIAEIDRADHDAAAITAAQFGPFSYLPDDTYSPARPRFTFDVDLYLHTV